MSDYLAVFPMLIGILPSSFYKERYSEGDIIDAYDNDVDSLGVFMQQL